MEPSDRPEQREAAHGNSRRIVRGALLSIAALSIALLALLIAETYADGFVVRRGYVSSQSAWTEARSCVGITHEPDWRDGWRTYCIGLPHGRWRCWEQNSMDGSERPVEVPCK